MDGLVIENTFTSITALVDKLFPWMTIAPAIKNFFLRIKWDSYTRLK